MNGQIEEHGDIIASIISGSKTIDSIDEFKSILDASPDNPALLIIYADLLAQKNVFDDAAGIYRKAARLFIESGMILQAILSKIQEWSIIRSSDRECRNVYSSLQEIRFEETPVYNFFARMTYFELSAVVGELKRVRFPAGAVIKELGDVEDDIYFIASGVLRETVYHSPDEGEGNEKKSIENLIENNFLGDIYPFEEEKLCYSVGEAITGVDLIKISKSDLIYVCRKYPNIEFLTMELCRTRSGSRDRKSLQTIRTTDRYQVQTKVTIKIFPDEAGQNTLVINGITEDISIGGACIRLGEKYWTGSTTGMVGKNVKVLINIPKVSAGIDVLGAIAWRREVSHGERKNILIGVQFKEMGEEEFNFLKKHCYVGDGEQDMIYSLWESYVKR